MTREEIALIVEGQRGYFESGATLPVERRIDALTRLRDAILSHETDIAEALYSDLGKSNTEGYMCETGMVLSEINYMLRHVRSFAKEQTVATPLVQFASRSYRKPSPYGVTLIMSPWNYPVLLTLDPLVDALAAGNTAVVKPSAYSPATSALLKTLLESVFPAEYVAVVTGGREENACLLDQKFDYIFFTGSKAVGQTVLEKAARVAFHHDKCLRMPQQNANQRALGHIGVDAHIHPLEFLRSCDRFIETRPIEIIDAAHTPLYAASSKERRIGCQIASLGMAAQYHVARKRTRGAQRIGRSRPLGRYLGGKAHIEIFLPADDRGIRAAEGNERRTRWRHESHSGKLLLIRLIKAADIAHHAHRSKALALHNRAQQQAIVLLAVDHAG